MRISYPKPVLTLYTLCKEFKVLPEAGGLYDQDPELISNFSIIAEELHAEEKRIEKEEKLKPKRNSGRRARRI